MNIDGRKWKRVSHLLRAVCRLSVLTFISCSLFVAAQTDSGAAKPPGQSATTERNGQHDFDFELGSWSIHLKRRLHPLTGSNTWVEFDGTSVTRKLWDGRAQIEEFETDGAGGHIEGLTLRTYSPQTHQWRLYWANSNDGIVVVPQIGQFKNGQGEFYAQDTLDGKSIFIRFIWSKTDSAVPHFEQSFSDDGGKTWEVNWITDQTRASGTPNKAAATPEAQPPQPSAPTIASTVDRDITAIEKQIIDVAEVMPEDKFNFSPESSNIPGASYKGEKEWH